MQVNGGKSVDEKVDFAFSLFEQPVGIDAVFAENEMIDTIAISKGRGTEGVVTRWGVTRLPRKTHRGLRKVASLLHLQLPGKGCAFSKLQGLETLHCSAGSRHSSCCSM
jgi:ribosomal protein L3